MRVGKILLIIGAIITIFGGIFHLQGQSVIGPESSFMYANPEWISYGIQILFLGLFIIGGGIVLIVKKTN